MIVDIIDGKYRLASDAHGWKLQERQERKSGERWHAIKYYATLPQAIRGICEYLIRVNETASPDEALKQIERVSEKIGHLVAACEGACYETKN